MEAYNKQLGNLIKLRDACKDRIDERMEILEKMGSQYSDVYVNNQAACVAENDLFDLEMTDGQTDSTASFYERGYVEENVYSGQPEPQAEIDDEEFLCVGRVNFIISPVKPRKPPLTGLHKVHGYVGFDFYGKFKKDTEYGGVHIFVDSNKGFSNLGLRGVKIDTTKHSSSGAFSSANQNDVISIGDYNNLKTKYYMRKIRIKTSVGHDSLNINGMIGKFDSTYANSLIADLGEGENILSFQGITRDRDDISGVYCNSRTGQLKYFHGPTRYPHMLGTVRNVALFCGSPFDDHVILHPANFKVVQIAGSNVYEFNCNDFVAEDLSGPRQFQTVDKSSSSPNIQLQASRPLDIKANDVILQNRKLKVFDTRGQSPQPSPRPIFEVSLETATTGNLFINNINAGSRPINLEHINPVLITGQKITMNYGLGQRFLNFEGGDKSNLLFLKWPTHQTTKTSVYEINMKGGTDYVVVSDKYLLDRSGIDGESLTFTVRPGFTSSEPDPVRGGFKVPIMIKIKKPGLPFKKKGLLSRRTY